MANPSVTYTFTNGTVADASQVNQNFTDLINGLTDGSKSLNVDAITAAGTATFNGDSVIGNASGDASTVNATMTFAATPKVDTIAEKTAAAGVNIDGVLLKDSGIVGNTTGAAVATSCIGQKIDWGGTGTTSTINDTVTAEIGDGTARVTLNKGVYLTFAGGIAIVSDTTTRISLSFAVVSGAATISSLGSNDGSISGQDAVALGLFHSYNQVAYILVTQDTTVIKLNASIAGGNCTLIRIDNGAGIRIA
jgi:hypothetical protein